MKYITGILAVILVVVSIISVKFNNSVEYVCTNDYLRIHVRANSNLDIDQNVKYEIKDKFVLYLTPYLADCKSKSEVINVINQKSDELKQIADSTLSEKGFAYTSNIKIDNEYFPTRCYDGVTLESGYYDAVIVELGEATGNNWWCVIYPPLCFVSYNPTSSAEIVYKSKILEIIKQFFGK